MNCRQFTSLLLALSIAAACAVTSARADDEKKMTADEIIAKHLEAVGGREAIAKFKTRVAIGTVVKEDEPAARFAVMSEAPNRLSVFYGFRDYDARMIYDGSRATVRPAFARQLANLTEKYEEILASGLMFNQMSLYNLLTSGATGEMKFEAKGTKKVKGRQAYVVQVKPKKGSAMRLYFDAENFMWVRTDYGKTSLSNDLSRTSANINDINNQAGAEQTFDFYIETSDFRDVDGVKLPFKFEQVMTAPLLRLKIVGTIVGTVSEYQHNGAIDPAMFQ
ncbi:MAG TPA: hypothetical protein VFX96_09105 [Pyrinomonadaceae bacterium]|nr:hypothetical protein [Pyrinomonadaceae bacterium]